MIKPPLKMSGFTLIELMIVVAIIAILAAIAIPNYQKHILRSHEKAAIAQMYDYVSAIERWKARKGTYLVPDGTPATDIYPLSEDVIKNYTQGATVLYEFEASDVTKNTFTLTATAKGGQTKLLCQDFIIDQTQTRSSTTAGCTW